METEIGQSIEKAARFLRQGEVVGIPTETVYGLAASAFNIDAVTKIFEVKGRPTFNPLIVHVADLADLPRLAQNISPLIFRLAATFWPGPLTIVLDKKDVVPDLVTGGGDTVAVRMPDHPMALELISLAGPLAAPSANPFGYISPVSAEHVKNQLEGKIPYILDGGDCKVGVESTVVMADDDGIIVLRYGGITIEALREVVPDIKIQINQSSDLKSPGQLKSHYSPRTKLLLGDVNELSKHHADKKLGILTFIPAESKQKGHIYVSLSETGNMVEAAKCLFTTLRSIDNTGVDLIICERVPDYGLGLAINDRLERAAADHT